MDGVIIFLLIDENDCKFYDAVRIGLARSYIKLDRPQEAVELFLQVSAENH